MLKRIFISILIIIVPYWLIFMLLLDQGLKSDLVIIHLIGFAVYCFVGYMASTSERYEETSETNIKNMHDYAATPMTMRSPETFHKDVQVKSSIRRFPFIPAIYIIDTFKEIIKSVSNKDVSSEDSE